MKRHFYALFCATALIGLINLGNTQQGLVVSQQTIIEKPFGVALFSQDSVVWKYRTYKGKLQRRRWNETQGYWVDNSWETIS